MFCLQNRRVFDEYVSACGISVFSSLSTSVIEHDRKKNEYRLKIVVTPCWIELKKEYDAFFKIGMFQ